MSVSLGHLQAMTRCSEAAALHDQGIFSAVAFMLLLLVCVVVGARFDFGMTLKC
jgi:hypothetical protein